MGQESYVLQMTDIAFPVTHSETVIDEWVDYNGHMNLAFYVLIFDRGTDGFLETIGMTAAHREATGSSVFVAETHVNYRAEVMSGEPVSVETRVIDFDSKRLHLYHEMHSPAGVAASNELMILHVDLTSRRVCPFPVDVFESLSEIAERDMSVPRPSDVGRSIGIRRGT